MFALEVALIERVPVFAYNGCMIISKEVIAVIAAGIAVVGNIPYLWDMAKKKIQPHPYTWFVWSIVSGITMFGQFAKGAGVGAWPTAVSEGFTIVIFLASLRYGFKHIAKRDTYFLIAALLGLIPWALTHDPTLSVVVVVSIDLIAFIPTLQKTWRYPKTERPWLYASNVLRHGLALFALEAYNVATMLHSITMIIVNTVMVVFMLRPKAQALEKSEI